ncbi:MAG: hypothetical protein BXU00_00940 [Candidatus Nanoclepta minutus]|uniref:methionine--tRNA ligase n=1 Tax=Candidatus Nanoclepta minutus TaxID=1940235 RepID=A0A397WP05_9ARCH|nr:MAG: hypothetical protein BXU00_00940 [Candidatus Nanoclepta minutus]
MTNRKFVVVTAALPYSNNVPHIGHMVGSHLPADVFARYQRFKGNFVVFVGGTDEHGTPIEVEAIKNNLTPDKLTDFYYGIHKKIYEWFDISYDNFSRTSKSKIHYEVTKRIFLRMYQSGVIIEKEDELPFDPKNNRFLPDRYVTGKCPYCGYEKAKGDQCENCGRLLDPKDLIDPKNAITGDPVILKKTRHLYFDLRKITEKLREWIEKKVNEFSNLTYSMSVSMLNAGLRERSITRDIKWGVPVPYQELWRITLDKIFNKIDFSSKEKMIYTLIESLKELGLVVEPEEEANLRSIVERNWPKIDKILEEFNHFDVYKDKVFYVWFDAPIGYLSFTIELLKDNFTIEELEEDISNVKILSLGESSAEIEIGEIKFRVTFKDSLESLEIIDIDPPYYFKYYKKIIKALLNAKQKRIAKNNINWRKFWTEGEIYHFIGKDNIPFHTLFWPGIIMSSNLYEKEDNIFDRPLTLPKNVFGYAYLTYEGSKISKSQRWGVFCDSLIDSEIHPDYWRFYLAYLIPENKDTSFLWDEFVQIINRVLVDSIGNLTHRILKFAWSNYKKLDGKADTQVIAIAKDYYKSVCNLIENGKISSGLKKIFEMSDKGNVLFQENKPWEDPKNKKPFIKGMLIYLITMYSLLSFYIPFHSMEFFRFLGIRLTREEELEKILEKPDEYNFEIKEEPKPLFKKLDVELISKIREIVTKPKY